MLRVFAKVADSGYCRYLQEETVEEAYWQGRGAELLEIECKKVQAKEFNALAERIDPRTGEELKPRCGQTIAFYDAVVHPPKSLSILSMVDERMTLAHRLAAAQLMAAIERQSAVWSHEGNRPSGNLIMAAFEHRQSREPDLHLHTHVAIMNMSYDAASGSWKALRAEPIFHNRHELTESYRKLLARRLEDFGYQIADKQRTGFEIEGVPDETIARYSNRSIEIRAALREGDRRITTDNVARWTRDPDKTVIPPEQFRESQLARLTQSERRGLTELAERAHEYSHKPGYQIAYGEEGQNHRQLSYGERIGL